MDTKTSIPIGGHLQQQSQLMVIKLKRMKKGPEKAKKKHYF
jgi:hypothetical protein